MSSGNPQKYGACSSRMIVGALGGHLGIDSVEDSLGIAEPLAAGVHKLVAGKRLNRVDGSAAANLKALRAARQAGERQRLGICECRLRQSKGSRFSDGVVVEWNRLPGRGRLGCTTSTGCRSSIKQSRKRLSAWPEVVRSEDLRCMHTSINTCPVKEPQDTSSRPGICSDLWRCWAFYMRYSSPAGPP